MSEGYVEAAGQRIWYEEAGAGPVVLLMHAGGADGRMWDATWDRFASRFHAVRIDLPGAGRSPYPQTPWEPVTLIASVLDALAIERAALIGVSLSGANAIDVTLERPDRVWALVVVASGPRLPEGAVPVDERRVRIAEAVARGDDETAARLFLQLWCPLRTDPELDARIREMVEQNVVMLSEVPRGLVIVPQWHAVDRTDEIAVPTLTVWGDADLEGVRNLGRLFAARLRDGRAVELPGVDHFVPMRAPQAFIDAVMPFVEEVRPD
jgi:pimeloyl-ACP methyl ester carboxylesterase